jgi:signal transduction histidine kinase
MNPDAMRTASLKSGLNTAETEETCRPFAPRGGSSTSGVPHMNRHLIAATLAVALAAPLAAHAGDNATKEEAVAMVKKGIAFIRSQGKDKGYAEITNKGGQFTDRDLYLVVYGHDGVVRAHGANEKMIGKNLIELKDVDGKAFVKERVELSQSKGTFWQDYKFTNPVSKKIEPKQMYCERLDDVAVCGGIYK